MNRPLSRLRVVHPVVTGLVYIGMAIVLLWLGFQPPAADPPPDLKALQARTELIEETAKAAMNRVGEIDRLSQQLQKAMAAGDSNALRSIQITLQTHREALEKLAADQRRQTDVMKRVDEGQSTNPASKTSRRRWFSGVVASLLVLLAAQTCFGRGRSPT